MEQTDLTVRPATSRYRFPAGGVELDVRFTTPLLLDDLPLLCRLVSYVSLTVHSTDGREHETAAHLDASAELCVDFPAQAVVWRRFDMVGGITAVKVGSSEQKVLGRDGDDLRIDWGHAYLASASRQAAGLRCRVGFAPPNQYGLRRMLKSGDWSRIEDSRSPRDTRNARRSSRRSATILIAYDDVRSVEYFGEQIAGYWTGRWKEIEDALRTAVDDGAEVLAWCHRFDDELERSAAASGGPEYWVRWT